MATKGDEIDVPSILSNSEGIFTSAIADSSLTLGGLEERPECHQLPPS